MHFCEFGFSKPHAGRYKVAMLKEAQANSYEIKGKPLDLICAWRGYEFLVKMVQVLGKMAKMVQVVHTMAKMV